MASSDIRLSKRLPRDLTPSPFFEELERAKSEATPFIDMTVSSPVRVGLPVELDGAVDSARQMFGHWSPDASGWREAREAVARYYQERGGVFTPNQILVTASTSEAYSVLFKAFCNPGDVILTPMPGYPLLDTLAQMEHLECAPYFLKLVRDKGSRSEARGLRPLRALREEVAMCHPERSAKHEVDIDLSATCCPTSLRFEGAGSSSVDARSFRFVLDTDSLLTAPEKARILLLVSPHNPTGHIVSLQEWNEVVRFCEENGLVLVVDEVFGDYGFSHEVKRSWQYLRHEARGSRHEVRGPRSDEDCISGDDSDYFDCGGNDLVFAPVDGPKCPIFWLNGLSKAVGAPQLKFGWMAFYAPRDQFEKVRAALEFVEDAYLSASSCAQALAPLLLAQSADYESKVVARLKRNWNVLQAAFPSKYCPRVLGGWYAVLHLGVDDEELTLRLLREQHVLVQPGFFFDFEEDGWIVISLLQEESQFAEAIRRISQIK